MDKLKEKIKLMISDMAKTETTLEEKVVKPDFSLHFS